MEKFNGKLTKEQLDYLRNNNISEKTIKKIEYYLDKYKDGLTDYVDLVGDDLKPGSFLLFNLKHFGHLLDLDYHNTFS